MTGFTYDYENNLYATTRFTADSETENGFTFTVERREGSYPGIPDNGSDIVNNSIPEIKPMPRCKDITVEIVGRNVSKVSLDGQSVEFEATDNTVIFTVSAKLHEAKDLQYRIEYAL